MPMPHILELIEEDNCVFFECQEEDWFKMLERGDFKEAWLQLKIRSDRYINHDYPV